MARRLSLLVVLALVGTVMLTPGVAAGGGCFPHEGLKMTSSSEDTVKIGECAFVATVTYVDPGDKVRWINDDHLPHTVTGAALSWGTADILDRGDVVSYRFEDEGVFPYYCDLHPSMVGAVVVGDGGEPGTGAAAAIEPVDGAAAASATEPAPIDPEDGLSPVVVALGVVAALAGVAGVTRYALTRRASAPSAS